MKLINTIKFINLTDLITDNYKFCIVSCQRLSIAVVYYQDTVVRTIIGNTISEIKQQIRDEFPNAKLSHIAPNKLTKQILNYFAGKPIAFECNIALYADGFTAKVIKACSKVPYGTVISYTCLAGRAGNEKAARAVGTAMKNNPTPLLVPCHRIIKANGKPGQYSAGSGTKTKAMLLEMENDAI